jgi:sugar-specific transcriptional regulator TrmB
MLTLAQLTEKEKEYFRITSDKEFLKDNEKEIKDLSDAKEKLIKEIIEEINEIESKANTEIIKKEEYINDISRAFITRLQEIYIRWRGKIDNSRRN